MRINKWLASHTNLSRRKADEAIEAGRVKVNDQPPEAGQQINDNDEVTLDGRAITPGVKALVTIILNKPVGYVCSRRGQGSKTIYELLPPRLHYLNPVGRLDKDSSGLLLMTNDGDLANQLMHPSFAKQKIYQIKLDKPLAKEHLSQLTKTGVDIGDSRLSRIESLAQLSNISYQISLSEGRNRQIRRTFEALGYKVTSLHRIQFGQYKLSSLASGKIKLV